MFTVHLSQKEINLIGKYIDIALKTEGIATLKDSFVILTKLENAIPVESPEEDETDNKKPAKSKE